MLDGMQDVAILRGNIGTTTDIKNPTAPPWGFHPGKLLKAPVPSGREVHSRKCVRRGSSQVSETCGHRVRMTN